jgi:lipopolysaccharide/colanic/teichoic acid biosynthesis glycosyltransferase
MVGVGQVCVDTEELGCTDTRDGKRLFDLLFSLLLIFLTGPILLFAILLLWLSSLGTKPVIYRQTRIGLNGETFTLLKLRTMKVDAEYQGPRMTLKNDPRITRLGHLLRRSRIDELPQLINVLRGDMSLIGPRPERPEFAVRFEREIEGYAWRYRVMPGITGLAQVRMGYAENMREAALKFYYDITYIRNRGLYTDFSILLQTLFVVVTGKGAR